MTLLEAMAWAVVELDVPKPDIQKIKNALVVAMAEATEQTMKHELREQCMMRLMRTNGEGR